MNKLDFDLKHLKIGKKGKFLEIKGIKFSLVDEENVIALVGESGLGKTTIYKSLFSTYVNIWKSEFQIEFNCNHTIKEEKWDSDKIIKGIEKPNFGFATQVPYFYSSKTVEENLFFPLKWIKNPKIDKEDYLKKFELDSLRNQDMHELSGGQRQIVNLARVFLSTPNLVIIDESFSNMDENLAEKYFNLIKTNYPDTIIFLTSHRTSDITKFGAKQIKLCKKQDESGHNYITMET